MDIMRQNSGCHGVLDLEDLSTVLILKYVSLYPFRQNPNCDAIKYYEYIMLRYHLSSTFSMFSSKNFK